MELNHPCKVQLRDFDAESAEVARKIAMKFDPEVMDGKYGMDLYFRDVNDARRFISKLRKSLRFKKFNIKMSTSYAGLRKGRVRVFFVYSLRMRS